MAYSWIESTPFTGAIAMFELKELLVSVGWTVLASGDGLAIYGAASDVITTGESGANGFANTKAWFRIRHPDGVREFTFQKAANNYQYRIKFSLAAGFTGGTPGFDQTASAADEVVLRGAGTDAAPSYVTVLPTTDGAWRWKAGADNAAPYNMWAYGHLSGTALASGCIQIETLDQLQATDGDGTWIRIQTANPVYTQLWLDSGVGNGSAFVPAVAPVTWTSYGAYVYYTDGGICIPDRQGADPITHSDTLFPIFFGRKSSVANPGFKGVSTQMMWSTTGANLGETLSTTPGAKDRIVYGDMNLPWKGTDPEI